MTWEEGTFFSYSFEQSGFETHWMLANSSLIVWMYLLHGVLLLLYLAFKWLSRVTGIFKGASRGLMQYLFYNGPLRLFMETYFDLYVTSLLNVIKADWNVNLAIIIWSNWTSLTVLILLNLIVVVLAVLYYRKFYSIENDTSYNALLKGTSVEAEDRSRWLLFFPAHFFGRRIAFTLSVLLFKEFIWGQIVNQFAFSITMIIYLVHVEFLETPFAIKMEVFNECTIIMLLYGLMLFTTYVPDPMVRYRFGWTYIFVSLSNIFIQVTLLALESGKIIKEKIKAKCCKGRQLEGQKSSRITNRSHQQMIKDDHKRE